MLQGGYMSIIIMKRRLTIRWSRPEIQPDLPRAGLYRSRGRAAQNRYAAGLNTPRQAQPKAGQRKENGPCQRTDKGLCTCDPATLGQCGCRLLKVRHVDTLQKKLNLAGGAM